MPPTLLVVDDNRAVCDVLTEGLRQDGYDVLCASNGPEALEAIERRPIDLVLTDLLLAGGIAGDAVATHAAAKGIRVITMSGALSSDTNGQSMTWPHLQKPVRLAELIRSVRDSLASRESAGADVIR